MEEEHDDFFSLKKNLLSQKNHLEYNKYIMSFDHSNDDKLAFETSESVNIQIKTVCIRLKATILIGIFSFFFLYLQVKVVPTFDSIGLKEDLLRGIYAYNFEKPSAIQQRGLSQDTEKKNFKRENSVTDILLF